MAKEYCYYIEANQIAMLEFDTENGRWDSPSEAVTNGFIVEYTKEITAPTTYTSSINVSRDLVSAIVYFLKSKMVEDKDPKMAQYNYGRFLAKVRSEYNRKTGVTPRVIPKKIFSVR